MGLDTKIYCNHSLQIPNDTDEIVELLATTWKGKVEIVQSIETEEKDKVQDLESYSILVYPKFIEFEKERFNQITIGTNFKYSANIRLYQNTIQLMPIGIGRNATNMLAQFMDEPFSIYADKPIEFKERIKSWILFKSFLKDITKSINGNKHLYINDGIFQGVEDLAWDGKTVEEMITAANNITKPCNSKSNFLENHTSKSNIGVTYIKGDIWFCEEIY